MQTRSEITAYSKKQIENLCKVYSLPNIEIKVRNTRGSNFKAWGLVNSPENIFYRITIAIKSSYHSLDEKIVHEFAHYLTFKRHGRGQHHNDVFKSILLDVARYYYQGKLELYAWNRDYPHVYAYYRRNK